MMVRGIVISPVPQLNFAKAGLNRSFLVGDHGLVPNPTYGDEMNSSQLELRQERGQFELL